MGPMVFDAVEPCPNTLGLCVKQFGKRFRNIRKAGPSLGPFFCKTRHAQGIEKLRPRSRPRIARDGNVIEISDGEARSFEAVANCRGGKSGGVFDAIESFLLNRRDELAIAHQCGRGIRVVSVDAQDIHHENPATVLSSRVISRRLRPRSPQKTPSLIRLHRYVYAPTR